MPSGVVKRSHSPPLSLAHSTICNAGARWVSLCQSDSVCTIKRTQWARELYNITVCECGRRKSQNASVVSADGAGTVPGGRLGGLVGPRGHSRLGRLGPIFGGDAAHLHSGQGRGRWRHPPAHRLRPLYGRRLGWGGAHPHGLLLPLLHVLLHAVPSVPGVEKRRWDFCMEKLFY